MKNIDHHHAQNGKYHSYTIKPVLRGSKDVPLRMKLKDGNFKNNANVTINIPEAGKFSFLRYERPEDSQQNVSLIFSEKIDTRQNLDGLISIDGYDGKLKLSTIGNQIKVIPSKKINGSQRIEVNKAIQSVFGNALSENVEVSVTFEEAKPLVKLLGKGVIVPDANQIIVPFEAIGLDAVDVEIFKIYENNMLQYLESNAINDRGYNLQGVGHIIYQGKVSLDDLNEQYNSDNLERYALVFDLDLSISIHHYLYTLPDLFVSVEYIH